MASLLYTGKEFAITHIEMIKVNFFKFYFSSYLCDAQLNNLLNLIPQGIKNQDLKRCYNYNEKLIIPIIENTPFEEDLTESLAKAIAEYPATTAVLVRRHGVYVWGDTWESAKTQ